MKILAIESSCDETAAAVVEDGRKILSNIIASQAEIHRIYGGVVPEIASRKHIELVAQVTDAALKEAEITLSEIDAIAVVFAPGLIGALLVGVNFAKALAVSANKPLIPVHHIRGHIAANYLEFSDLKPPFLCLVASGGHSHIIKVTGYTDFTVIGRTRDDAAGEAFDKAARVLSLPYPGGVEIDTLAKKGDTKAYSFPQVTFEDNPYDFSFSGVKTALINKVHTIEQRGEELVREDIAASFNEAVSEVLCEKLFLAAKNLGESKIVVAGGVAANSMLRQKLSDRAKNDKLQLFIPSIKLCGDNAAMSASQGYYEFLAGNVACDSLNARATLNVGYNFKDLCK